MKINVKRTKAWEADNAPYVWGFFNVPTNLYSEFKSMNKEINESFSGNESSNQKFYFDNIRKIWYTKNRKSVDLITNKITEHYKDSKFRIEWNTL